MNLSENTPMRFDDLHEGVSMMRHLATKTERTCDVELQASESYLFFCLDGPAEFQFGPMYMRPLPANESFFIHNPSKTLKAVINMSPGDRMIGIQLSIIHMHQLFLPDDGRMEALAFLSNPDNQRPIYDQKATEPPLLTLLESLFDCVLDNNANRVMNYGKLIELLGKYFYTPDPDLVACPFLKDEETIRKIHMAKSLILDQWQNPPTIAKLAELVGLNEYRLKAGFKEVYNSTVYGYVMDTKMNRGRKLLGAGKLRVNDVAFEVGYTNPSHFIAAFKRQFGITPKKYMLTKR